MDRASRARPRCPSAGGSAAARPPRRPRQWMPAGSVHGRCWRLRYADVRSRSAAPQGPRTLRTAACLGPFAAGADAERGRRARCLPRRLRSWCLRRHAQALRSACAGGRSARPAQAAARLRADDRCARLAKQVSGEDVSGVVALHSLMRAARDRPFGRALIRSAAGIGYRLASAWRGVAGTAASSVLASSSALPGSLACTAPSRKACAGSSHRGLRL